MTKDDVKIGKTELTPELNEDGTPKIPTGTDLPPAPIEEEDQDDVEEEEIDDENIDDSDEDDEDDIEGDEGDEGDDPKDPVPPVTPPADPKPPVDYKKKFGESTRRNQIVESQFRELQKTLGDITKQEIPTDEEMRAIDPDWEYRSDFEKNLSIKTIVLERRQNHIFNTIGNITKESEFAEQISTFIDSHPELNGKDAEFYDFVTAPKNKGADMEVLLGAFLHKEGISKQLEADPNPQPLEKKKAPTLARATPTGGMNNKKPKDSLYSDEELTEMRTKNPKKYFQLIRQGKLRDKKA